MPRQVINITTLHDGLNLRDNATSPNFSDGATEVCIGVDLTITGVVKTAAGYVDHDLSSMVPSGVNLVWAQSVWMGGVEYILCATSGGFYSNGTLISGGPSAKFKAIALGSNIYILAASSAYRFDGTTIYQWGITAPSDSDVPTITAADVSEKVIDDFEGALADFITNQSNCTISSESTIIKEGSKSMKMAIAAEAIASTWDTWAEDKNFEVFDDEEASLDGDIIRLPFYTDNLNLISSIKIVFDVGDGTFSKDTYSYTFQFQREVSEATQVIENTIGIADEVVPVYTGVYDADELLPVPSSQNVLEGDNLSAFPEGTIDEGVKSTVTTKKITAPFQAGFQSDAWCNVDVPKENFTRIGSTGDWTTVCGVKIVVTSLGAVNIYFDELIVMGGGELTGDYYFMFGWGRADADGNVIHYSGPARDSNKELTIQGPITFNTQKVAWGTRTASTDPQVNCCVIYISGGTLAGWMVGHVIDDNGVTSGEEAISEDDLYTSMPSLGNEPAPGGNDMLWWGNRFWIAGPSNNRGAVRCSEISAQGDMIVEGFPNKNTVILGEGGGELYSIHELNGQFVVLGKQGEYSFMLSDLSDLSSIHENNRPSDKHIEGRNAYLRINDSLIYPAVDSFIESNGMTAKAILPTVSNIIPASNMGGALGVYRSFDGFFYFNMPVWGKVVARLDFFSGKPRISIQGQHEIDCFLYRDENTYVVIDGSLYLFDSGYSANGDEMWMQIRSKAFSLNKEAVWQYLAFQHNTGGNYFRVRVLVDGVDRGFQSFMSTTRTEEYFMFGPVKGNSLQVQFEGDYRDGGQDGRTYGEIYLPVRLYVDG